MPDRMRAVDRPDVEATFDHNDHCVGEGWATWAAFCRGKGLRYQWHRYRGHHWIVHHDANPGYRRCTCGRREHWYSDGVHRYGSFDRSVWEAMQFCIIAEQEADR